MRQYPRRGNDVMLPRGIRKRRSGLRSATSGDVLIPNLKRDPRRCADYVESSPPREVIDLQTSTFQTASKEPSESRGIVDASELEQQALSHVRTQALRQRNEVNPAGVPMSSRNAATRVEMGELKIHARPSVHLSNSTAATRLGTTLSSESCSLCPVDGLHVLPDLASRSTSSARTVANMDRHGNDPPTRQEDHSSDSTSSGLEGLKGSSESQLRIVSASGPGSVTNSARTRVSLAPFVCCVSAHLKPRITTS
jgi:hypothetical protein